MPIQVLSKVPENPRWVGDNHSSADYWAFRCLMFYAGPLAPAGGGNPWQLQIAQTHIQTGDWRFLVIRLGTKHLENKPSAFSVTKESAMPEKNVAEMKFWTTQSFKIDAHTKKSERVEYTHRDLMHHLRDPRTQDMLLADGTLFARNFVSLLIDVGVIASNSLQTFNSKLKDLYIDYNVPVSVAEVMVM
ncbi:unnamed protein product [Rhizoctonia solani]|uniref:Uncharacterized protein n=1 Tax=Rhizoctonia solani TaxID=456999 RepID=A0A8H3GHK2_9AGAM|nr:unnamed protein product [Rhizoctonia solani]